ncbi:hypothetical protein FRC07_005648 [Ceratobasidium sp. 392]|nr:hypothetical protein FRC07_005648 [Ceratobasidium sp. 392]
MANHNNDSTWLRRAFTFALSTNADGSTPVSPKTAESEPPPAPPPSSGMPSTPLQLPQPVHPTAPTVPSSAASDDDYAGWRPQPIPAQQAVQAPPLSPLDLAMYPGVPAEDDPDATRKAVSGLKPLRILSARRPGGPSSAGPSGPPSASSAAGSGEATRFGLTGLLSAAKRASGIVATGPSSSSSSRTNSRALSVSHTPIPISPLPPPRTPPLVPTLRLAPELTNQVEPALKAYLESLTAQAASIPSSSTSSSLHRNSNPHTTQPGPIGLTEDDEDIVLEIRDLDAGRVISVRNLDAEVVNPSHTSNPIIDTTHPETTHTTAILDPYTTPLPNSPNP